MGEGVERSSTTPALLTLPSTCTLHLLLLLIYAPNLSNSLYRIFLLFF
jgi:hypothetical protein